VGGKLGGNVSYNNVEESYFLPGDEKSYNGGFQIGGVGKLGLTKDLSIQSELVYSTKGYGVKNELAGKKSNKNYRYIGLPILANYSIPVTSDIKVYGSGGFYTDVLTGVKYNTVNTLKKAEDPMAAEFFAFEHPEYKYDQQIISDFYKRVEFGWMAAFGAEFPVNKTDQMAVDLRLAGGFTDVEKNQGTSKSKNFSVQVSAIYLYDLTKHVNFIKHEDDAYEKNASAPVPAVVPERVEENNSETPVDGKKVEEENRTFNAEDGATE